MKTQSCGHPGVFIKGHSRVCVLLDTAWLPLLLWDWGGSGETLCTWMSGRPVFIGSLCRRWSSVQVTAGQWKQWHI